MPHTEVCNRGEHMWSWMHGVKAITFSMVQTTSCNWHTASVIMRLLEVVYFSKRSWPVCMCCLPCARSVR